VALFSNKQESNLRSCVQMVEDVLAALGHTPDDSRLETQDGLPAWRVQKGSAHVYVILSSRGDRNFLRVIAPVMHLVPSVDERALYRRLLELNCSQVSGAAFAIREGDVVLTSERSTTDLDPSEVLEMVQRTEDYADQYDDLLVSEFGGRMAGLSSAPIK
jgi:type III secretion system-like peptide-binding chaperone